MKIKFRFASASENEITLIRRESFSGDYLLSAVCLSNCGSICLDRSIELLCHNYWNLGEIPVETSFESLILRIEKICKLSTRIGKLSDSNHTVQLYVYLANRCLIYIRDASTKISQILPFCPSTEEINFIIALSSQAGEVWRNSNSGHGDCGVHYAFHSKEAGKHSIPHIHIRYRHESEAAVSILDGKVLAISNKKFPKKRLRAAQRRIVESSKELLHYWNNMTDGFGADPDYLLKKKAIVSR